MLSAKRSPLPWPEILFWALLAVHLIPFLAFRWFPTLDGPCHLYNARVILDLLRGDELTGRFFEINPFPEPNWLGHAIMAAVQAIAPAFVAEKVIVLGFALGLPLAFRYCARQFEGHDPLLALLIYPFIMSYPLRMGFFNFCLGLPLMLLTIGAWRACLSGRSRGGVGRFTLLLLVLYFSHLAVALVTLALMIGLTLQHGERTGPQAARTGFQTLALSSLPLLILAALFFLLHSGDGPVSSRFAFTLILQWIADGRPFVSLSDDEVPYTRVIAMALLIAAIVVLVLHVRDRSLGRLEATWWLASAGGFVAAFVLPDAMASGRFLTPRLLLFAMLFLGLAISTASPPRWLAIPLVVAVTAADLLVLVKHHERTASLVRDVQEFTALASACPDDAVLLPLNYSDNWMHSNLACYTGAIRGTIVLDNYEAATPHMPIRWREGQEPYAAIGDFHSSNRPCIDLNGFRAYAPNATLLLSTWKMPEVPEDSCTVSLRAQLDALGPGQGAGAARSFKLK